MDNYHIVNQDWVLSNHERFGGDQSKHHQVTSISSIANRLPAIMSLFEVFTTNFQCIIGYVYSKRISKEIP